MILLVLNLESFNFTGVCFISISAGNLPIQRGHHVHQQHVPSSCSSSLYWRHSLFQGKPCVFYTSPDGFDRSNRIHLTDLSRNKSVTQLSNLLPIYPPLNFQKPDGISNGFHRSEYPFLWGVERTVRKQHVSDVS